MLELTGANGTRLSTWMNSPQPTVLGAHEVEDGKHYYLVPTTAAGLYRYDLHDLVRVAGFHRRTFSPTRSTLIAVGDCRHDVVCRDAAAAFEGWDGASVASAIAPGALKRASVPEPSTLPGTPADPASVVTLPLKILRTV